jgi:hypothetical protein
MDKVINATKRLLARELVKSTPKTRLYWNELLQGLSMYFVVLCGLPLAAFAVVVIVNKLKL